MKYRALAIRLLAVLLLPGLSARAERNYIAEAESLLAKGQLQAAEIQLKNAVRSDPANMLAHYRLATVQLQLGDAAAAEHEAQVARASGYDPDRTTPLLAETYLAQRKYRQLLQEFPGTDGSTVERSGVLVARGAAQLALGNVEEAHKSFKGAQQMTPNAAAPLVAEARLFIAERQVGLAEPLVDRALENDPTANEARVTKAQLLRVRGKLEEAVSKLNELIATTPSYAPARLERAEIFLLQKKEEAARADVDAVLSIQPGSVRGIYLNAFLAVKTKDFEKANNNLQKLSGVLASLPRGYFLQAFVQLNLNHLDQAEDAAKRYAARFPEDLTGQKLLAVIELALRRPAASIDALSKFEETGTADAEALGLLARAYAQVGNTAQALSAYSAAVKLDPKNAVLHARLGVAKLRAGHTSEGVTELEESLALAPSAEAAETLVVTELAAGQSQRALEAAKGLQQAQPDSPVPGNLLGVVKLARFELDEAATEFAAVLKKNPDFLPAQLNQARVLEFQGKADEAEGVLQRILNTQPANAFALNRFVELLFRTGKADAALQAAERAHAVAPADQGITVGLVDLYLRRGDKNKALALAQSQTQEKDGNNAPLVAARARAELAAGKKSEAAQTYQQLIALKPLTTAFRRQLAAVLLSMEDLDGAQRAIEDALERDPNNRQLAEDRIAIALKAAGVAGAVETANELKASRPGLPTVAALEGDAYLAAKDYGRAADAYAKALQQSPSAMLALRLASAKASSGNADAAAGVLREWLATHPDDSAVTATLAAFDLTAQRFDEARKELEQVVQQSPQDPVALNNLAWLYQRANDPRARSLAERAYLLAPNSPQTADTLGWILVQQGQSANALGLLKEAARTAASNPTIKFHLAVALKDVGQRSESLRLLHELISASANFDEKPAAEKLLAELSK